jgi:hypothetical protein
MRAKEVGKMRSDGNRNGGAADSRPRGAAQAEACGSSPVFSCGAPGRTILTTLAATLLLACLGPVSRAQQGHDEIEKPIREIFVPFEDLHILLENQPRRVMLSRQEYETLLRRAEQVPDRHLPKAVVPLSAEYAVTVGDGRARITGTVMLEVLADGLQVVDLELAGVGLREATLDGHGAAIGSAERGGLKLFVEGIGRHQLTLQLVTPVETTAALQTLAFTVPTTPATRMSLDVPGDVEIRSGAPVVSRVFDQAAQQTHFELLPQPGQITLVMTLNNRLLQSRRVVVARSVIMDEVTESYERVHATFSMAVLHRPVDRFRFALPVGFEVTHVNSPLLSHWAVEAGDEGQTLAVQLREQTGETVVISLSAVRTPARLESWELPELVPLDVVGEVAVVGVLLEEGLQAKALESERLIPIDTSVLTAAFPATLLRAEPGARGLRALAAFYAPTGWARSDQAAPLGPSVRGRFEKPAARLLVTTNLLLLLGEREVQIRGGFALKPEAERLFTVDVAVPPSWHVLSVTGAESAVLPFEVVGGEGTDQATRIRVRLPEGVAAGEEYSLYIHAVHTPAGWLSDWSSIEIEYPALAVLDAARDLGAIAVQAAPDTTVYPNTLEGLTPLDEGERAEYGLAGVTESQATLAYRYEARPYRGTFRVERIAPRITAWAYSFIRLEPGVLRAHHEIVYDVAEARARRLSLWLPSTTPADVSISALDGVTIKEYESEVVDGRRRWTVHLAERQRDRIRLAVDYEQRLLNPAESSGGAPAGVTEGLVVSLPVVRAADVAYQSGIVAVEGSAELEVQITEHPRRVDVGELAAAEAPEWQRLGAGGPAAGGLGVFEYVGDQPQVTVRISRPPGYGLSPAIVQRAEMVTLVSAEGTSQTAARLQLRTKAALLEVELPAGSQLWSMELDSKPAKPQREAQRLLLNLPAAPGDTLRDLRIVYETPVDALRFWGAVEMPALRLRLRMEGPDAPAVAVPLADLDWHLCLPSGFQMVRHAGTLTTEQVTLPEPAAWSVARMLCKLGGSVNPFYGGLLPTLSRAREFAPRAGRGPVAGAELSEENLRDLESLGYVGREQEQVEAMPPADKKAATRPVEKGAVSEEIPARRYWALAGVRSLKIELERLGETIAFQSLGVDPELNATLANRRRVEALAYGLAIAVGLVGLALTNRRPRTKTLYVLVIGLATTLIPLIIGRPELLYVMNPTFWVACALALFYLVVLLVKWCVSAARTFVASRTAATPSPSTTAALALALILANTALAEPPQPTAEDCEAALIRLLEPRRPVDVPEDAIIVPYDPQDGMIPRPTRTPAERILVSYRKFVELWNLAYPDDRVELIPPPAAYALAGGSYTARLEGDDYLRVDGRLDIEVYHDEPIAVPLVLAGGVLTHAELDGGPANLGITSAVSEPQVVAQAAEPSQSVRPQVDRASEARLALQVHGKGQHRLELTLRMKIARSGGWRSIEGRLPHAPATALTLRVPQAGTDVRLTGVQDRRSCETTTPEESIDTVLGEGGRFSVSWRSRVQAGQVDPSLTATSATLLDVREDGLRLIWQADLNFGRTEGESFSIVVPADYLVQKVEGANVRGWTVREAGGEAQPDAAGGRQVDVTLLKSVVGSESVAVILHRQAHPGEGDLTAFDVPVIHVVGAALHSGQLTIRRSPLLELRTERAAGVTRIDVPPETENLVNLAGKGQESPLGIRPYQAYRFATAPFALRLVASSRVGKPTAEVQTVLRIAERQRSLESRVNINPAGYPVYRVRIVLPGDLWIEQVSAPGAFEWSETVDGDRKVVLVYLASGQQHGFPILVRGTLGQHEELVAVPLPRIEVLDVGRQSGNIVVQVDPAFDLQLTQPKNCHEMPLGTVRWLIAEQRPLARMALGYKTPDYTGVLQLTPRQPIVSCSTITNVRVTETTLEETILLSFNIRKAGIRSLSFQLPSWMSDARITVPMLRLKQVEPVSDQQASPVRVRLWLQDEVMGSLRVLVENDRLLTPGSHQAPIPIVETGQTSRRYVTLESAGRDEVVIEEPVDLQALTRRQEEWRQLVDLLGTEITQAYMVTTDPGTDARLAFKTKERLLVETAGARIGLAQTVLSMDSNGAYRAGQSYRIANTTEQFLEVELPAGADLWSVLVAGEPVKPASVPGAAGLRRVRIPLVRTTAGDLDCEVILNYGGQFHRPGGLRAVSFPLISTVNVPVELSQVRLFLPETYRWFDFGGTMRQVTEAGDLAADYLRYQTRMAERLSQTLEAGGLFAKARAATSFKNLKSEIEQTRQSAGAYGFAGNLQQEISSSEAVISRGEQQLEQFGRRVQRRAALEDNRARLGDLFAQQRTTRARNLVQDLPGNFAEPTQQKLDEQVAAEGRFNQAWIAANTLDSSAARTPAQAGVAPESETRLNVPVMRQAKRGKLQPQAPEVAQKEIKDQLLPSAGPPAGRGGQARRRSGRAEAGELVERYQQQLEQRGQQAEQLRELDAFEARAAARGGRGGVRLGLEERGVSPTVEGMTTGLASLAIEFPMRGVSYSFTTPRGQAGVTARAISHRSIETTQRLAAILLVIVIGGALYRLVRRDVLTGATGSTMLIAVGIVSVLSGVLPIAGLVLIIVGGVIKNRRRRLGHLQPRIPAAPRRTT